ncbi:hypothetical protein V1509DRAFT_560317 [Lipomyces kononenkoae]
MALLTPIISPMCELSPQSLYSEPSTPRSTTASSYSPTPTVDTSPAVESPTQYPSPETIDNRDNQTRNGIPMCPIVFEVHTATTVKTNRKEAHDDTAVVVDDDTAQYECDEDSVDFNLGDNSKEPNAPPPPEYVQRRLEAARELDSEHESGNIADLIEDTSRATTKVIMAKINNVPNQSTVSGDVVIAPPMSNLPIDSLSAGSPSGPSRSCVQSSNCVPRRAAGGRSAHKSSRLFLTGRKKSSVPYDVVAASPIKTSNHARARLHSRATASQVASLKGFVKTPWSQHPSQMTSDDYAVDYNISTNSMASLTLAASDIQLGKRISHGSTNAQHASLLEGPDSFCDTDVEMTDCDTCEVNQDVEMMDIDEIEADLAKPRVLLENTKRAPGLADDGDVAIYFCFPSPRSHDTDEDESDNDNDDYDNDENDHDDINSTNANNGNDEDYEDYEDYEDSEDNFSFGLW